MVYNFRPEPNTDQAWSGIDTPGLLFETMDKTPNRKFFRKELFNVIELGKNYSLLNLYIRTFGAKLSKKSVCCEIKHVFFLFRKQDKKTKNI
jgi:hypothetical protein